MAALGRPGALSFVAIDALVRLLTCLIQAHGLGATLLAKALVVICGVLQVDAPSSTTSFLVTCPRCTTALWSACNFV